MTAANTEKWQSLQKADLDVPNKLTLKHCLFRCRPVRLSLAERVFPVHAAKGTIVVIIIVSGDGAHALYLDACTASFWI